MIRERSPLKVRERHYSYDESIPKYYDQGNAVLTAEFEALSLIIPPGERFFIRSVQHFAGQVSDPDLKRQIQAFSGQEAMHSKETCRSLELLEKRGFPAAEFMKWHDSVIRRWERWLPFPSVHLRSTAALEHYTSVIAVWYLTSRYGDENLPPAIRDLWNWHTAEELEHKAVAFDLIEEVAPSGYLTRVVGYIIPLFLLWFACQKAIRMFLKWGGLSKAEIRKERKKARRIRRSLFSVKMPHLWDFLKPGFHPNNLDDGSLGRQVLTKQDEGTSAAALNTDPGRLS